LTGRVFLSAPDVGHTEEQYLVRALRSGWAAPVGPDLDAFERELAHRTGVAHAVALSSGTAALHLALLALGLGEGSRVLVPTLTFAATANAVVYTGATPVFVDCDPVTGNLDVALVDRLLATTPVDAVMPVDLFGECADYDTLEPLCAEHGVPLIEDAAEALGSTTGGRAAGSFGAAAALSFNGNKIMTTSGGGALLTGREALANRCRYLATQARQPVAHYEHTDIGYNYRLSNLLAALGRAQLHRLDDLIASRIRWRASYGTLLADVPGVRLLGAEGSGANRWLTVIIVDPVRAGWQAADLGRHLAARDIETRPVWKPMHRQPVFSAAPAELTGVADQLFANGLALPSGSGLTEDQRERVLTGIRSFLESR
jgi:dTDP-4-amino-4,6-dideoxygalactose transaminase